MERGFDCTTCSTYHPFSLYVFAHKSERMLHRCPVCKAEHAIHKGVVTMKKPGDPAKANPPEPQYQLALEPEPLSVAAMFGMPTPMTVADMFGLAAVADPLVSGPTLADLGTLPELAPEPNPPAPVPPQGLPWVPVTATFPFDTDPCSDRVGWYEFVARMTGRCEDVRMWWNGEDWQPSPEGSPVEVRYNGYIGWRGLLAQGE